MSVAIDPLIAQLQTIVDSLRNVTKVSRTTLRMDEAVLGFMTRSHRRTRA